MDDKIDYRTLSRAKKTKYDHERARQNVMVDWLSVNCIFNGAHFKAMYRISRSTFEIISQRLGAVVDPEYRLIVRL